MGDLSVSQEIMKHLILVFALIGNLALADVYELKTKVVEITPPVGANLLETKEIEKRFTNGNPPNVVFDIEGAGATLTIKESITWTRDASPSEFASAMIGGLRNSLMDFELVKGEEKNEGDLVFYEIQYTDTSKNNLEMMGRTRIYMNNRTIILVGFRMPIGLRNLYESRMLDSISSFTFPETYKANQAAHTTPAIAPR